MIAYQRFSKFSKTFERAGLYYFEAVASSEQRDAHGTTFDLDTLRPAVPYLPVHIEHESQPVGSVIDYWRSNNSANINSVSVTGAINPQIWPELVKSIKTGEYIGVSIGGVYSPDDESDGVIYNALINEISLTNSPSNPNALIYQRSKSIEPKEYFALSGKEQFNFFRNQGFSEKMAILISESIKIAMN